MTQIPSGEPLRRTQNSSGSEGDLLQGAKPVEPGHGRKQPTALQIEKTALEQELGRGSSGPGKLKSKLVGGRVMAETNLPPAQKKPSFGHPFFLGQFHK